MRKIGYEFLGSYFKREAEKEFGGCYSDETSDWLEHMRRAENNGTEDENGLIECHLEVTKTGHPPLLIDFTIKHIFDENDNVVRTEYYV